jgi:hypothetical protein
MQFIDAPWMIQVVVMQTYLLLGGGLFLGGSLLRSGLLGGGGLLLGSSLGLLDGSLQINNYG